MRRDEEMAEIRFESHSEEDTVRLGRALAAALPAGSVMALNGTLGAGKTRLVQAVAEALGIDRHDVVSPTFVLMQEYHGEKSIYHVDAYRIRDDDEFMQLGMEEYFAAGGLVFIEWAERVAESLPPGYFTIAIEVVSETSRKMTISSSDRAGDEAITHLKQMLG
jgi:tRNA threonylcarbamoyladenosine biosynthesis protein TsaE